MMQFAAGLGDGNNEDEVEEQLEGRRGAMMFVRRTRRHPDDESSHVDTLAVVGSPGSDIDQMESCSRNTTHRGTEAPRKNFYRTIETRGGAWMV